MNGIDATKILRDEGVDTPIIALTANALEGDRDKYLTLVWMIISVNCDIKHLERIGYIS